MEEEITYTAYSPSKLNFGRPHPDPCVENATLADVTPPEITYNLAMPANIIHEGKLSNLQLEAIVYGCQRFEQDLPRASSTTEAMTNEQATDGSAGGTDGSSGGTDVVIPERSGFLLGDSAGMGKGRTLAGFLVESISRGCTKSVWISVSHDLYEDAKRDLSDLGLGKYASKYCFNLGKGFKSTDTLDDIEEGVMFLTYSTLIAKGRFDQLLSWCGGEKEFNGLICLDECHKCKTIDLDSEGVPKKGSSQTATKVVELQKRLPRARVVYCSATSVSEPQNLAFMNRLGLWGGGTEHRNFNEWLDTINRLGTGAIELNAMHLKSLGALQARQLSYSTCDFNIVDVVSDEAYTNVYEQATKIWVSLYAELVKNPDIKRGAYWSEHLRFFQYLATAAKVDTCIKTAKQALEDGHCCIIGLQESPRLYCFIM